MVKKKRRKKSTQNVFIVLLQTLVEMLCSFKYGIIEELGKIAILIQIVVPIVISQMNINVAQMFLLSLGVVVVVNYLKEIGYRLNHVTERGFPIPVQRYTEVDENGFVGIKETETQEAILYLREVEDYLKSKGRL